MKVTQLVLNGRKWFITGAAHPGCRLLIVMCRSGDEGADSKHAQHSMVLVPMDTPGVTLVRNIPIMQHHSPEGHCEILLRDVRVPAANLLGQEGAGFAMAQARLGPGRVHHCMRTIGQCELALELMCDRTLERHAFGKYLADIRQRAGMDCRVAPGDRPGPPAGAARRLGAGSRPAHAQSRVDVSAIKVVTARLQTRVVDRAMQVFGAMGLSPDTPLAWFWTWGRALRFLDGPDEVHLRTVARQELRAGAPAAGLLVGLFHNARAARGRTADSLSGVQRTPRRRIISSLIAVLPGASSSAAAAG